MTRMYQARLTRAMLWACAFLALSLGAIARAEAARGQVIGVDDAVTLRVAIGGDQAAPKRVRLRGVDAPPSSQPDGTRALQKTAMLAMGKEVAVELAADGVTGDVTLPDGRPLARTLVEEGFAWRDRKQSDANSELDKLELDAREAKRGLWAEAPNASGVTAARPGVASNQGAGESAMASSPSAASEASDVPKAAPGGAPSNGLFLVVFAAALILAGTTSWLGWQVAHLRKMLSLGGGKALDHELAIAAASSSAKPSAVEAVPLTLAQAEAVEASRHVVQDLVRNLNELVGTLVERNATHSDKVESYKASIQKAMTVAGLEQIERLLLQEIEEMQKTNAQYRADLEQANARIKEQETILEDIRSDAKTDFLTRVANRRGVEERLFDEFARARRYGNALSIAMIDIDHFKRVNDAHGHVAGDKTLQVVAHVMEGSVRQTDMVGRYGGEEFLIVLPETPVARARVVAEKIRVAIEAVGLKHGRETIKVTVSAGVGELSPEIEAPQEFIARVDAVLYHAKQAGRNRVEVLAPPPATPSAS